MKPVFMAMRCCVCSAFLASSLDSLAIDNLIYLLTSLIELLALSAVKFFISLTWFLDTCISWYSAETLKVG